MPFGDQPRAGHPTAFQMEGKTMCNHFSIMKSAIDRAAPTLRKDGDPKKTREAFRAFMSDILASVEALAYEMGGDGSYISDEFFDVTGKNGAVDSVFHDLINRPDENAEPAQQYSTMNVVNLGTTSQIARV